MTEQDTSGGSAPVADPSAPAHTAGTAAAFQASDASANGAFGATRGSGLARGKRNAQKSATPDAQPAVEYKPTSIELITPQREYSNPFASETPANVPVEAPVPVKTAVISPVAEAPVVAPAPVSVAATSQLFEDPPGIVPASAPVEKSELKILPPEETKRSAVSWDSNSAPVRDERRDRPVFKPAPRAGAPIEPPREERPPGEPQAGDRPRHDRPRRDDRPRDDRPQGERSQFDRPRDGRRDGPREPRPDFRQERAPEVAPKSGGFIGWLKRLFGAKPATTAAPSDRPEGERREGGRGPRRDGRGRGGEGRSRGGEGRSQQQGQAQGGEGFRPESGEGGREGGHRRRRRGRGRGRGGYDGGGRESEGQQGGGAI